MKEEYWDVHGLNKWGIKVPAKVPKEAVLRMAAAMLSYEEDVNSIDYVYKKWKDVWEKDLSSSLG